MNLVIDYGNSAAKVGIFDHLSLIEKLLFHSLRELEDLIRKEKYENFIVSSVNADAALIYSWAENGEKKFILEKTLPLPIRNLYLTPETLGMDRLAAVCGARQMFPSENCLVIDAGTCITYDFIDRQGDYQGGSISPGLNMRFQAVHTLTAKLPLVSPKENVSLVGNTTETCIQSGVINGLLAETDGIIRQYKEKFKDLRVILCGGDSGFFENQMKASIFASPDLVLIGLNSILIYNVNHS
jgi:type III pantothenate kinase